jgi:hypothetical protein
MSSDESGGGRRRPREIDWPRLPPGPLKDLNDALRSLHNGAGQPPVAEVAQTAQRLADELNLPGAPGKDTVHRIFRDPEVPPNVADVVTVAAVLAYASRPKDDVDIVVKQVRQLWERARTASAPYGMVRVHEARPRLLGVHAAIRVDTATRPELPAYVPRDLDRELCRTIQTIAKQGGLVLLVGGSSSGKTRTLVEAVQHVLPHWWLLHPTSTEAISTVAVAPMPRTVLWLDELPNYLDSPAGLSTGTVRDLITAGTVLVATMWRNEYADRSARPEPGQPDSYANDRRVLGLAEVMEIPDAFSGAELDRAEELAGDDRRIRVALDTPDAGVTQVLAGGPQLVERWHNADPYARAVLTAAVDAVRLGVRGPLPAGLLQQAAAGYCDGVERAQAPADWFEQAVAYATRLLLGAVAPLAPVASGMTMGVTTGYRIADYLRQHAEPGRVRLCPPATFWDACLTHLTDQGDLQRLGHEADLRMRYRYAIALLRRARSRDPWLAERLGWLVFDQGGFEAALTIFRTLAETNEVMALRLPTIENGIDEARAEFDRDVPSAAVQDRLLEGLAGSRKLRVRLADKPPEERDRALAEFFLRTSSDSELRQRVESNGIVGELRQGVENNDVNVASRLIDLLAARGEVDRALPALYEMVDRGVPYFDTRLIAALAELGRVSDALRLSRFGLTADGHIASQPADREWAHERTVD